MRRRGLLRKDAELFGRLVRPHVARPRDRTYYDRALLTLVAGIVEIMIDWVTRGMTDPPEPLVTFQRLCLEVFERVYPAIRPGVAGAEIFALACDVFEREGYPTQRTKAEGGLKSSQLKDGAAAVLTVEREGNQPVITGLRLGGAGAAAANSPAAKAKGAAKTAEPLPKLDTSALVALSDLGPGDDYHGAKGGLYPGVSNVRPAAHEKAGLELARQIRPLDQDGKPAADGKIVLCTIGFSNTSQCSQGFIEAARGDKQINSQVVIVNGAQGGRSAFMIKNA